MRSLASGLVTIATDGSVLTANLAATEILRVEPRRDLAGTSRSTALMPGLSALLVESHGELRRADLQIAADDHELTLGVTVSPLRDERDAVFGRIVSFQDLTELRRLELHMRRAERLATVGQLAAGVAHEIRNPLAAISGSIELLRAAPTANEDDRALMAIVHREIHRLNALIGDLLDYANPRPSERVTFDLGVVVEETLQVARADKAFDTVELACEVTRPLPVHGDPAKLRQVMWNLVRNARDAAATGGKHVRVDGRAAATTRDARGHRRRRRPRHRRGSTRAHLRPVLHHEADRHRPRPRDQPRDHRRARRPHRRRQRGRRRHHDDRAAAAARPRRLGVMLGSGGAMPDLRTGARTR